MDRYSGPFGHYFSTNQASIFGGLYELALKEFLSMIHSSLTHTSLILDLMSGGGDVAEIILKQNHQVKLVITDRNPHIMTRIKTLSDFPNIQFIECEFPRDYGKIPFEGEYTIVICKKGIHEIPYNYQASLVKQIHAWLAPKGRAFFWLDGAQFTTPAAKKNILESKQLTNFKEILQIPIQQEEAGISEFINLWVFAKDWYNGNVRERDRRYFLSKQEFITYLLAEGFSISSELDGFHYRFNPINLNERAKRAELSNNSELEQEALNNKAFQIFCEFTQKHLFLDSEKRTKLGELLDAKYVEKKGIKVVEFSFPIALIEVKKEL